MSMLVQHEHKLIAPPEVILKTNVLNVLLLMA